MLLRTTMYDYDKKSLFRRIKEKESQGWEVEEPIFVKKVNLRIATTYGVKVVKKDV